MGEYLVHSKGKWKKHKYIRKEGNRYIYAEDLKKAANAAGKALYDAAGGRYKKQAQDSARAASRNARSLNRNANLARTYKQSHLPDSHRVSNTYKKRATKAGNSMIRNQRKSAEAEARYKNSLAYKGKQASKKFNSEVNKVKKKATNAAIAASIVNANAKRNAKIVNQRAQAEAKRQANAAKSEAKRQANAAKKRAADEARRRVQEQQDMARRSRQVQANIEKAKRRQQRANKRKVKRARRHVAKYIYRKIAGE